MRLFGVLLFAMVFVIGGCSQAPAPPSTPAALQPQVHGTLNQVMKGILFPNSNIIFEAQSTDPAAPPAEGAKGAPGYDNTYGGWQRVENASIALAEAANLIVMSGRKCENGKDVPLSSDVFQNAVQQLRDASMVSYKAAQAKNQDAILDAADKLTQACAACHEAYRDKTVNGQPSIDARCS